MAPVYQRREEVYSLHVDTIASGPGMELPQVPETFAPLDPNFIDVDHDEPELAETSLNRRHERAGSHGHVIPPLGYVLPASFNTGGHTGGYVAGPITSFHVAGH